MSQNSKAKRDKRKKQQAKRPFLSLNAQQQVQNHAVLTNEEGQVVAAIGLQGREWLLAIGGQSMGNAENPVPMLAMLQHLANVQEKEGRKVTLEYSDLIKQLLAALAEDAGQTAEEYLAAQVAQFEQAQAEEEPADGEEGGDDEAEAVTDASDAAPAAEGDDAAKPQA
ncbi:MAG: hypothetical protein GAK31_03193 [Stenotrophomonas maltophilia]|uniref:Uncharacterized protein n=1 Tax=Stenotrophomonas maltophilia TaxID=40324 RepID=A0A7V8FF24_STEMA|nr:MAG: hypothetical protein GAK31_03193 [Stenotrophomonas maltophilia]